MREFVRNTTRYPEEYYNYGEIGGGVLGRQAVLRLGGSAEDGMIRA
jgi:hypothetical protein